MKKIKCLAISLLMLTALVKAKPVEKNTAATVAKNFYSQTYNSDAGTPTLTYTEFSSDGKAVYYVFDIGSGNGFVIVSAEDAGSPIIASSNTGHYVVPPANNNVGFWMNSRKSEIVAIRTSNIQASTDVTAEWTSYINNTPRNTHQAEASVTPLLGTIEWDQSPYYNAMCPGKSVTGCVATAMAQIMKYWSYPSVGLGSWCYYDETPFYSENYGDLCATFDTSHYVWSAMPNRISSANSQIAKLMYDCGVSVDMNYTPTESGSVVMGPAPSAENSYVQFFNYDPTTIAGDMQAQYTTAAWLSIIKNELNNKRPVQYEGNDSAYGGHSWVCDGYNSSNQLHMNWGWSGYDDGYFTSTDLAPANTGYNFSYSNVGAIIGIQPPASALGVAQISNTVQSIKVYPNPSNGIFNVALESIAGNPQIAIYNVLGQSIYACKLTSVQTSLNLGSQPKGVYLYRIMNENGSSISTGRLVIE